MQKEASSWGDSFGIDDGMNGWRDNADWNRPYEPSESERIYAGMRSADAMQAGLQSRSAEEDRIRANNARDYRAAVVGETQKGMARGGRNAAIAASTPFVIAGVAYGVPAFGTWVAATSEVTLSGTWVAGTTQTINVGCTVEGLGAMTTALARQGATALVEYANPYIVRAYFATGGGAAIGNALNNWMSNSGIATGGHGSDFIGSALGARGEDLNPLEHLSR